MVTRIMMGNAITQWETFLRTRIVQHFGQMGNGVFCVMYDDRERRFRFEVNSGVGGAGGWQPNPQVPGNHLDHYSAEVREALRAGLNPHIGLAEYTTQQLLTTALEVNPNEHARFTCAEHLLLSSWLLLHRGAAYVPGSLTFLATLRNANHPQHTPISPCSTCTVLFAAVGVNYFQQLDNHQIGLVTEYNDDVIHGMIHRSM